MKEAEAREKQFPAPREVYRYLYKGETFEEAIAYPFPAPLEVDRYLYRK